MLRAQEIDVFDACVMSCTVFFVLPAVLICFQLVTTLIASHDMLKPNPDAIFRFWVGTSSENGRHFSGEA